MRVIEQISPDELVWGESIVVREFNTARTIELIESGLDSLTFSKPVITELAKPKLVIPGSLLVGLLWGFAFVFVRNRIRNRTVPAGQNSAV